MSNKELVSIQKQVSPVVAFVGEMTITSSEDMSDATSKLSELNKFADNIKIEKEKITKPINEALKEVRAKYKPVEDMVDEAISILKKKMGDYQMEAIRIQKEQEKVIAEKLASGKIKVETALKRMDKVEEVENKVKTENGSVSFRTEKDFQVEDISLLPKEYLLPNEVSIRSAMKKGTELPGVKYFEKQVIVNRR